MKAHFISEHSAPDNLGLQNVNDPPVHASLSSEPPPASTLQASPEQDFPSSSNAHRLPSSRVLFIFDNTSPLHSWPATATGLSRPNSRAQGPTRLGQ